MAINSLAHTIGAKDYDTKIAPRDNKYVGYFTMGEGSHNYHHTFPFDYSSSELSWRQDINLPSLFIDCFAALGLAYDLKKASPKMIKDRIIRTGDQESNQVYVQSCKAVRWSSITYLFILLIIIPVSIKSLCQIIIALLFL